MIRTYTHKYEQFLNLHVRLSLDFVIVCLFRFSFSIFHVFYVSLLSSGNFIPVLLAFLVLGLVSSLPSQEICWVEHL